MNHLWLLLIVPGVLGIIIFLGMLWFASLIDSYDQEIGGDGI